VKYHNYNIIKNIILKSIIASLTAIMLFACKNDIETISSLTFDDTLPVETAKNIELFYSDSGRVVIRLLAPRLNRYATEDPYIEFPEGLHLFSYDSLRNLQSELTANYGVNWEKKKVMEVKDDVVIINHPREETLNTEHVIWDQRSRKIYSEVFVKRTTKDGVLYGQGFDADESLSVWKLRNVSGEFEIEEEKSNEN
jgi:LPS export ABC transporter protein LptC